MRRRVDRAATATTRGRPVGSGETAALLRDRNFRPYLVGNMLSTTGTWFQTLAQAILVYRLTHSTFLLGVVGFASYAGVFALVPITGRVADRYDRRKVLIATELAATAVTGSLCAVTALGAVTPALVIGFAFLSGSANAFATPSQMALAPTLVEPRFLSTALALNSATFNIGRAVWTGARRRGDRGFRARLGVRALTRARISPSSLRCGLSVRSSFTRGLRSCRGSSTPSESSIATGGSPGCCTRSWR